MKSLELVELLWLFLGFKDTVPIHYYLNSYQLNQMPDEIVGTGGTTLAIPRV